MTLASVSSRHSSRTPGGVLARVVQSPGLPCALGAAEDALLDARPPSPPPPPQAAMSEVRTNAGGLRDAGGLRETVVYMMVLPGDNIRAFLAQQAPPRPAA